MYRSQMLQHYRMKQRQYLQWRSEQQEKHEEPCYFPPHLRQLRNEWFAKRYEKYGRRGTEQQPQPALDQETQSSRKGPNETGESEAIAHKIWRWLSYSEQDDQEEQDRSLHKVKR